MRQHPTHSAARFLTALVFVLVVLGGAVAVSAQTGSGRIRDLRTQEENVTILERDSTARKRDPKEVMIEVNEDLSRLNVLNEGLAANATAANNQPPNYKDIVESVAEIKKRATRLKTSLALPTEQNEEKSAGFKDAEKAELQPVMTALNKLLEGFLHNPIFSDSGPIDMRLAARARRDLEDVIVLSEKLRKNAEKRSKSTDKTP